MKKMVGALIFLVALSISAFSAIPQQINYQGILKDSAGRVINNSSLSVVFTIYDAATAGTNLWNETQTVSVESGLFSVKLGSTTSIPTSIFDGTTKYLGIAVGSDSEMSPRAALISVPYSYRSLVADSVSGVISVESSATTGTSYGIYGASNSVGAGGSYYGPAGIYGISVAGIYTAGVRGYNSGTASLGIGVIGTQNGSGYGVYGATPGGFGVVGEATNTTGANYGVWGICHSPSGAAVYASNDASLGATASGSALKVRGAIAVDRISNSPVGEVEILTGVKEVSVANTCVRSNSIILLTVGTAAHPWDSDLLSAGFKVNAVVPGTSFNIRTMDGSGVPADCYVGYMIIN